MIDYHADLTETHPFEDVGRFVPTMSIQLHCEQLLRAMKMDLLTQTTHIYAGFCTYVRKSCPPVSKLWNFGFFCVTVRQTVGLEEKNINCHSRAEWIANQRRQHLQAVAKFLCNICRPWDG